MWRVTQVSGQWVPKHQTGYRKGPTTICCKPVRWYHQLMAGSGMKMLSRGSLREQQEGSLASKKTAALHIVLRDPIFINCLSSLAAVNPPFEILITAYKGCPRNWPLKWGCCIIVRLCVFRDQRCGFCAVPCSGVGGDDESRVRAGCCRQPSAHGATVAETHATASGKSRRATTATEAPSWSIHWCVINSRCLQCAYVKRPIYDFSVMLW